MKFALVLLLGLLASPADAPAEAVELRVLTYNTHGIPAWAAGDAPERRFPKISVLVNRYDVALLQEDFSYHEELVSQAEHPVVLRGNGSRLAWLPLYGSGLTALVRAPPDRVSEVVREPYEGCSGWFSLRNDCFASKGFLRFRLALPDGRSIDFYQTHLESGGQAEDQEVRAQQLEHLTLRIAELSGDAPLIVAGDFNLNYARAAPRAALVTFQQRLRLRDSGAREGRPRRRSRIDYIFYRSGPVLKLEVLEAGEAREFRGEDEPLSDHPALFSRFRAR